MPAQLQHPFQIMFAGGRWLRDDQHSGRAGQACNRRAADTGRTVDQDQPAAGRLGNLARLLANERDELARIPLAWAQMSMNQRTKAGVRDKPVSVLSRNQLDGVLGAEVLADAAALAGCRIDTKRARHLSMARSIEEDRVEAAQLLTLTAGDAMARFDAGAQAADKRLLASQAWIQNQRKVGGIHVAIRQHRLVGQGRQRSRHRSFAGAALAA